MAKKPTRGGRVTPKGTQPAEHHQVRVEGAAGHRPPRRQPLRPRLAPARRRLAAPRPEPATTAATASRRTSRAIRRAPRVTDRPDVRRAVGHARGAEPGAQRGPVGGVVAVVLARGARRRASATGAARPGSSGSCLEMAQHGGRDDEAVGQRGGVAALERREQRGASRRRSWSAVRRPRRRGPTAAATSGAGSGPGAASSGRTIASTTAAASGERSGSRLSGSSPHALAELGQAEGAERVAERGSVGRRPARRRRRRWRAPRCRPTAGRRRAGWRPGAAGGRRGGRPAGSRRRSRSASPAAAIRDSAVRARALGDAEQRRRCARAAASAATAGRCRAAPRPGPIGRVSGVLRVGDMCSESVRYRHGQRAGRPADDAPAGGAAHRRAAHRPAHGHRHAGAGAADRAATHRRPAQRRHRRRHLGAGARHHRARRVDRSPARLRGGLRAHGPGLRPLRDPRPRGRPQAAVHQQAVERLRGPLAGRLPVVRAARRVPPRPLRPPQGRVRARRARHEPLQRLPDHRGELPPQDVARRARHARAGRTSRACCARSRARTPARSRCASP